MFRRQVQNSSLAAVAIDYRHVASIVQLEHCAIKTTVNYLSRMGALGNELPASRILHHERMDTRVGPMKIDVLQPLHSVKITLDGAEGISGELTFEGRHFPVEEPRFQRRSGSRTVMDVTRMTQNGSWNGWIEVDGERIEVSSYYGTRDRSWGVRPIGTPDPQPVVPEKPFQFYWVWTPLNFGDQTQ